MRAIIGLSETDKPMTNRVGSWIGIHCGDHVYDQSDPRHIGRVDAITATGIVKVRFENGWVGEIDLHDCRKAIGDFTKAKASLSCATN